MAGRVRKYTVDVSEVEEMVALSEITGDDEETKSLRLACKVFGIVLDEERIADKALVFAEVAAKIAAKSAKSAKKAA